MLCQPERIVVPQPVPKAPDFPPRDGRAEIGGKVAKLRGGLADDQQAVFDGKDGLFRPGKAVKVHPRREPLDALDILDDVAETQNRIARRHAQPRRSRIAARAA